MIEAARSDIDRLGRVFPHLRDYYRARAVRPDIVLAAVVGDRPVGAVLVTLRPPHEAELVRRLNAVAMLHKLIVDEPLRNRRIGTG